MMTGILMAFLLVVPAPQAIFWWEPASGPVASYRVKVVKEGQPDQLLGSVPDNGIVIACGLEPFTVVVRAVDGDGLMGPLSPPSELVQCTGGWNPDFNGDLLINGLDFGLFLTTFGGTVVDQTGL